MAMAKYRVLIQVMLLGAETSVLGGGRQNKVTRLCFRL